MDNPSNNVDILFYQDDVLSRSLHRVLSKYSDLTLFTRKDVGEIIPDLIIFTENDPYLCVSDIRGIPDAYKDVKCVYVRSDVSEIPLGIMTKAGVLNLFTTDISGDVIHKALLEIGITPAYTINRKFITKFLNKYYSFLLKQGITFQESVVLGAKVRGYPWHAIENMLRMSRMRFFVEYASAIKKLQLTTRKRKTIDSIIRYGCVTPGPKYKHYNIPKYLRHKPGYYLLPQINIVENDD